MIGKSSPKKVASLLIAILPILNTYKSGIIPVGLGDVVLFLIAICALVSNFRSLKIRKFGFISFFLLSLPVSLLLNLIAGHQNLEGFRSSWFKIIIYYFTIECVCSSNFLDGIFMQKCNVFAGVVVTLILYIQVFAAQVLRKSLTFFFPAVPTIYSSAEEIAAERAWKLQIGTWRPNSVFCEPSYYAAFVLMTLAVSLFGSKEALTEKQRIFVSVTVTIGIALSYSAIGLFIGAMLWIVWVFQNLGARMKRGRVVLVSLVIFIGILTAVGTDLVEKAFSRLETVSSNRGTTGTQRLLQGLSVFSGLGTLEKAIGIGFGNTHSYLVSNNITTPYLSEVGNEFMNGFSTVLVCGGVIGFLLYILLWVRMYVEHRGALNRAAFLVVTMLFCVENLFYSANCVMYLVLVCSPDTEACWDVKDENNSSLIYSRAQPGERRRFYGR